MILPGGDPDAGMPGRSMALRGGHQLRIRISNPILLQQTVWTIIDDSVPVVKETGGSSVAHPPPSSD